MHLLTLNATGKQLAPPRQLSTRRRRLSQVIGRHVDRTRPHMIAIQNARDVMQPIDEAWITRGWKVPPVLDAEGNTVTPGIVKPWPRRYLRSDDLVVVVYLPRGGSSGAGGRGSKSPLKIALSIAAIALVAFSGPIGGAIAGALSITSAFGVAAVTAGVVVAGSALMGLASKSKANKTPTDETKVYGIQGGGNLPRPGDRIPRGYGRHWMKPDLSQPDFNQYDGDDLILTKRHTLGVGRYRVLALRAGKQVFWREGEGFVAPFNDPRNKIEFLYGTPSTLAPSNVVAASGVGGELPRLEDTPQYAGPFNINERGALINRIQWDFQFPSGISRVDFFKSGNSRANQPGEWGVQFEYARIDDDGRVILPWMIGYTGNSGNEKPLFSTHPLRFTKFKDVPPGRYATRGVNVARDTSAQTTGNAHQNTANWDAASGWVGDVAVREGVTEIVVRLYATKSTGSAAFGEMEADAQAIIPVWNGSAWVEQETSKAVWAYCDVMRNQDYGGGLPENQVDRTIPKFYADSLTKFDTFDGTIRGPVSVFDAASTVLLPMRAEPVHLGRFWSLVRDDTKAVRKHMITRRQMVKGSTRISFNLDTASGAAHVIGEYDRDGDYRNPGQAVALFGEASLTPMRTMWQGVKTYEHAHHLTTWRAAIGAFRRQSIPFGVTLESRIYKRGDAITVDPWFVEGHSTAGVLEVSGSSIRTDWETPAKNGDWASFRDRRGREWGPVKVLGKGATPDIIRFDPASIAQAVTDTGGITMASLLDNGRGNMATVRIGSLTILRESYLIQSVQMQGTKKATVTALIDDPRVWDAIGQDIVIPPDGDPGLAVVVLPRIVGLTANATQMAAGLRCDYAIQPGRGAVRFEFGISYDGVRFETFDDADLVGSVPLNPVDPQTVTVRARAFGVTGLPGPYFNTPLAVGKSAVLGSLLDDFSVEFRSLSDYVRAQLDAVSDLGSGVLAEGHDQTRAALDLGRDTIRGSLRQIEQLMNRMASENATEIGNAYEARQLIKVGNDRNFAFIERVDEARVSDKESFVAVTTQLGNRLTSAEGYIVANGTAIFGLSSALDITNGNVSSVQRAVTTLGGSLKLLDLDIKAEATARSLLETRVSEVDGRVSVVAQDLVTLDSTLRGLVGDEVQARALAVDLVKTEVTKVDGRVTSEAQRTTALESTTQNLQGDLSNTSTALQRLTTRTETIEGNEITTSAFLVNLEGRLAETNEDIGATSQAVQMVSQEVTRVDGDVKSNAQAITALDGRVGNVAEDGAATARSVQSLQQTVTQVGNDLSTTSQAVTRLEGRIETVDGDNEATAQAVSLLSQEVTRVDGRVTSTAELIQQVKSTADGAESSVTILAGAYDGIKAQYSVVLEQDGQTGGFILTGVKKLGEPTTFEMRLRGDLVVERTITARNLVLTEGLIISEKQMGNLVVSTRAIGSRQVSNYAAGVGSGKSVDVMMNVREDSFVFLIGYAVNGPQTEFSTTVQPGQIQIQIDDTSIINSIPNNFVSTGSGDSRRSRILTSSIMGFSAPQPGMRKFTFINTSSADVPGVVLFVMEFAR